MVAIQRPLRDALLQPPPSSEPLAPVGRASAVYRPLQTFHLPRDRSYRQQYSDMYFLRLARTKPAVESAAEYAWSEAKLAGERARRVDRVLDVRQGELCWVTGTVYIDMGMKPNVLDDVAKDKWLSAPISIHKYFLSADDGHEGDTVAVAGKREVSLEDESGRIRLVGDRLESECLVTGCIIGVMGIENAAGGFEVIDVRLPGLAPQPARWALAGARDEDMDMADSDAGPPRSRKKVAIVSGLGFSGADATHSLELDLLLEYLLGEALGPDAQREVAQISRLIIAGNSISTVTTIAAADQDLKPPDDASHLAKRAPPAAKKYGYDATAYNSLPSTLLDEFLGQLLPAMPVTLIPGPRDPANASYPQQPVHPAMFPRARAWIGPGPGPDPGADDGDDDEDDNDDEGLQWLDTATNPCELEIEGWRFLGTAGQNVDDALKYVAGEDSLGMMEAMCRWRCSAPTAPDTLCSYPFQEDDPFVIRDCPHVYFVGCQSRFGTRVIEGPGPEGRPQVVRLVAVPSFADTKELVLVDTETLDVSTVRFDVPAYGQ